MKSEVNKKISEFFTKYSKQSFTKGEIVIRPWDAIKHVYYLEKGNVRLYFGTLRIEEVTMHIFTKGSFFPIFFLLSETENRYYFEAIEDIIVYKAPVQETIDFTESNPNVSFDLAKRLSRGLAKLLVRLETTLYKDSYYRVITVLIFLATKFGKKFDSEYKVELVLTHEEVASWCGIQRETASRQLEELRKKGFLTQKDRYFYVKLEELKSEESDYKYYLARK